MTDPISDMLNRIRNAQAVLKPTVEVPFSNIKFQIAEVLKNNGFLEKVSKSGRKESKIIEIALKYERDPKEESGKTFPRISGLRRISKPGQRIYKNFSELRPVRNGYGIAVVSTSKGMMTDKEARKKKVGGEVICEIW